VYEDTLNAIGDRNRFDADLYRFATGLFDQAASTIDMAGELERLRTGGDYAAAA
jgi:hypothetical protein